MKKLLCLVIVVFCGFGYIGIANAETIYKEKISKNQDVHLESEYFTYDKVNYERSAKSLGKIYYSDILGEGVEIFGKFQLQAPVASVDITDDASVSVKNDLVGKFTFFSSEVNKQSEVVYYVEEYDSETDTYKCVKETVKTNDGMYVASSYKLDEKTGKYTLVKPYISSYNNAVGMYTCDFYDDFSCIKMYKIINTDYDGHVNKADIYTATKTEVTTVTNTSKDTIDTTSTKNETIKTNVNPSTGIEDYFIYFIPIALLLGSAIVIKRKHI